MARPMVRSVLATACRSSGGRRTSSWQTAQGLKPLWSKNAAPVRAALRASPSNSAIRAGSSNRGNAKLQRPSCRKRTFAQERSKPASCCKLASPGKATTRAAKASKNSSSSRPLSAYLRAMVTIWSMLKEVVVSWMRLAIMKSQNSSMGSAEDVNAMTKVVSCSDESSGTLSQTNAVTSCTSLAPSGCSPLAERGPAWGRLPSSNEGSTLHCPKIQAS
mmetsp:Transcript_118397/g.330240  ORF Transcript_118397/g.330240 Transcript_118397/m.330240 type:complete len:218 (-) Transcript_118397:163-816(-)